MTNGARGEVGCVIGGRTARLCLTLGALAEIETGLGCSGLSEIGVRLSRLSASDLLVVLRALLRGGGEDELARTLETQVIDPAEAARLVAAAFACAHAGGG